MFEKESAKKWLVLLVILVALSLVVDLLSLNVIYDAAESSDGDLKGDLASLKGDECRSDCYNECEEGVI